ncbi:uncharacterized protein ACLA_032190 [Aspergillus clavatus NRRL 1]|uniref:Myb-like domain-containing protein n=1 Tax=Aspergillus clavatus (strain ATCC 1007 / CBS 513.65 / DSM 816 / NCTC 3887 / NRRL 1 / QM 1276 / 107) TaxID=344612 RepID=A1CS63_ASPCL|nr:uncharacterized protein ACLA_032190 [Aspergillus clavatus NRRL 1]EAW08484.1 conserved hypothetical protein [Aspergillus clavatus NRRL 1]
MPGKRRSPVKWDDWKDKVMLLAIFEQMNMSSLDFQRLSKVMCGKYTPEALKNRFRVLNKEATVILRDRSEHFELPDTASEILPFMSGGIASSDDDEGMFIPEVVVRGELTPPPSEPSPSMQSKRNVPQEAVPENVTPNAPSSSMTWHTQSNSMHPQRKTNPNYTPIVPRRPAGNTQRPPTAPFSTTDSSFSPPRQVQAQTSGRCSPPRQQDQRITRSQKSKKSSGRPFKARSQHNDHRINPNPPMTRVEINNGPVYTHFHT